MNGSDALGFHHAALVAAVACLAMGGAAAAPVTAFGVQHYLDNRSPNTIGRTPGLRQFLYTEAIPNGVNGTTVTASQGGFDVVLPFTGTTAIPNEFSTTVAADPSRYGPWTFTYRNGSDVTTALSPAIASGVGAMPFAANVAIRSSTASTTFSWSLPQGAAVDAVRFNLWDHGRLNLAGTNVDNVFNTTVSPGTTSLTLPSVLANGLPLTTGNLYTLELGLLDTATNTPQGAILTRSRLYVDFVAGTTPLAGTYLPVVEPQADGAPPIFRFNVTSVGTNLIYIDPVVAVGYRYDKGAGNPNFASVLLPTGIGDDLYQVVLDSGEVFAVSGGTAFSFATGGVAGFTVLGIEEAAGLLPNDPTAFITGVSFTEPGAFTGTMQAVVVPEAPTWALWVAGLAALAGRRLACREA